MPDFSKYIKTSYKIAKENKWLWIFGALTGAGGNVSFNWVSDMLKQTNSTQNPQPNNIINFPQNSNSVLGATTDALTQWLSHVPFQKWVFLVFLLILLVAIGIFVILLIQNWSRAALIKSINKAMDGENVNLANASPEGFKYLKNLILLTLLIFAVTLGLIVVIPLFWIGIFVVVESVGILKALWVVAGVLTFIAIFFLTFLITTLVNLYAERFIVLKDYPVLKAFKAAFTASRRTLAASIVTGVVNFTFKIFFGIIVIVAMAFFIGLPAYLSIRAVQNDPVLSVVLGTSTVLSFLVYTFVVTLAASALNVFTYANWNQLANDYFRHNLDNLSESKGKEDESKKEEDKND